MPKTLRAAPILFSLSDFIFLPVTMLRIKLPKLALHADRPVVDTMISAGLNTGPLL